MAIFFVVDPDLVNSLRSLINFIEPKHSLVPYSLRSYSLIHTTHFPFPISFLNKVSSSTQRLKIQTTDVSGKTIVHTLSLIVQLMHIISNNSPLCASAIIIYELG